LIVDAYSGEIDSLAAGASLFLGEHRRPARVVSLRRHADRFLLYLEGVEDRDQAEAQRGEEIAIPIEHARPLPEGAYYHWQILGLSVEEEGGAHLGQIVEILETGANDVYVVRPEAGGEILLPAISSVIRRVDLGSGTMLVRLLPGILPDAGVPGG
jgi:16S rRNA processing protein RimM